MPEMHHPPPHCAHIDWLVSINIQQISVNITRCHFFHVEEFGSTPLLHTRFHVRHHFVRLPSAASVTQQQNVTAYWWETSTSTAISPTSTSDVTGQHNKIGDIAFRAALVYDYDLVYIQLTERRLQKGECQSLFSGGKWWDTRKQSQFAPQVV